MERADENDHQDELGDPVAELAPAEAGGEAACFAPLLCPECGVVLDGGAHADGCTSGG